MFKTKRFFFGMSESFNKTVWSGQLRFKTMRAGELSQHWF